MKRSLKSVAAGELDVAHLAHDRVRLRPLAVAERGDLRPLPRDVAGRDDPRQRHPRHEPDPDRARRRQVGAERAGEQHLGDVLGLRAQLAEQDLPAGRDRGLGELQLAHVALGEVDRVGGVGPAPVHDEDALLADERQPVGDARCDLGGDLVGREAARVVEQPGARPARPRSRRARSRTCRRARRRRSPRASNSPSAIFTPSIAPSAARMPQRICAASNAGPAGRGGGDDAVLVAERDLGVRADVDEQPQPLVAREAGGEHARDDVAADVGAERRERERRRARMHRRRRSRPPAAAAARGW